MSASKRVTLGEGPYICTLPYTPPSQNEYTNWHWAKKKRWHDQFQADLWAVMNQKGNVISRGHEGAEISSVLTFVVIRGRDSDNYSMPMNKAIQDVLVQGGVIPNDTADRCTSRVPGIVVGPEEGTLIVLELRGGNKCP